MPGGPVCGGPVMPVGPVKPDEPVGGRLTILGPVILVGPEGGGPVIPANKDGIPPKMCKIYARTVPVV